MSRPMSSKARIQAMFEAGFRYRRSEASWVGHGLKFPQETIDGLELHEIDQVLEGVRQGVEEVTIRSKTFTIRERK